MFTQLDLFGDLPAPEKPSNQPQRAEKKSAARSGNASTQPVQTQLSMGLTEHAYPEPSPAWSVQAEILQPVQPELTAAVPSEQIGNDINYNEELTDSTLISTNIVPEAPETATPTPSQEFSPKAEADTLTTNQHIPVETRAEIGRRYYIQTEIPSDPPLATKPPGLEMMMAGLINTRTTAQEPKPRYIQTEIPSEPIQTETESKIKDEEVQPTSVIQQAAAGSTAELPLPEAQKQEKPQNDIPAESLRRTRPLMPPKVIMAEPDKSAAEPHIQTAEIKDTPSVTLQQNQEVTATEQSPKPVKKIAEPELFPVHKDTVTQDPEIKPTLSSNQIGETESDKPQPASRRKKNVRDLQSDIAAPGVPPDDQLNARQYYSIGEVATMFGVKSSLLRYWESEFDVLKLRKNRKGDRFFRPDDIRSLQLIHHLLRDKKYTIEGARDYMRNAGKMKEKFETIEALQRIRQFLVEMRNGLQIERMPEAQ